MRNRGVFDHYRLKPYMVCPTCQAKYTVDIHSKRRGLLIAVFAMMTFGLSAVAFQNGFPWSLATFISGTGLLIYVGYALSKMSYVNYED